MRTGFRSSDSRRAMPSPETLLHRVRLLHLVGLAHLVVRVGLAHGVVAHLVVSFGLAHGVVPHLVLGRCTEGAERKAKGRYDQSGAFQVKYPSSNVRRRNAATGALVAAAGDS